MVIPTWIAGTALVFLSACAESAHQTGLAQLERRISDDVRRMVDESVTFADIKDGADSHVGQTVMLGGKVLSARLAPSKTEVEILQLPLGSDGIPTDNASQSQGRFLAEEESFLDPATLPPDTPVTVIGTVEGEVTRSLTDGSDSYTYPVLRIVQILNWPALPKTNVAAPWPYYYNPYARYGPAYWGPTFYRSPFWYPYGYGGYGRYGSGYYRTPFRDGSTSRSAPGSAPPQFRGSGGSSSGSSAGSIPRQFQKWQP